MRAQNLVIAGDYEKSNVHIKDGKPFLSTGFSKKLYINGTTVKAYEVLNDEHQKSLSSGVARGIVGGALFGAVGMIAGSASGKTKGIYQIAVEFNDGKKSLLEVDETIHSAIITQCFLSSSEAQASETIQRANNETPKLLKVKSVAYFIFGILVIVIGFISKFASIPCAIIGSYSLACGVRSKTKTAACRKCKNNIGYKVKICPYCGTKDGFPLWLTAVTLLFGGILTFVAVLVTIGK